MVISMANPLQKLEGDWTIDGYLDSSGVVSPASGTCKGTFDGETLTLEYDLTVEMGGRAVPFPVSYSMKNFDEDSQTYEVSNTTRMGPAEGVGKGFPDFLVSWVYNADMGVTSHTVTTFLSENELKVVGTSFDDARKYLSTLYLHYTRA